MFNLSGKSNLLTLHAQGQSQQINTKDVVHPIIVQKTRECMVIDLIDLGKFIKENDEYQYVLTVINSFSKHSWTYSLKSKCAEEVAACVNMLFFEHGPWEILHSDNGTEFTAEIIKNVCKEVGTRQVHGAPYHLQSQGVIERFNQTLKGQLAKYMDEQKTM